MVYLTLFITGCAHFQPRPISALQVASDFKDRTLNATEFKQYLETNLHHEITSWPPKSWDFSALMLAAFYYHPDLDVARAQWGVAKAGIISAGGRPNPSVGFTPQFNANSVTDISPWTLGFTFDIPIETAGKRGYRIVQARHFCEAARLNIASTAWQVRNRLRTNLLNLYAANLIQETLEKERTTQEDYVKDLEERAANGEVSWLLVTDARLSRDQTLISLREAQRQVTQARTEVAGALGIPVDALAEIQLSFDYFDEVPRPEELHPEELRRYALVNRADILKALAEYAASESALQLEIAKQYPDIHLQPGYTFDQGDNKWALGLTLTLPVLNRNEGPIAVAKARREEVGMQFLVIQSQVINKMEQALAGYKLAFEKFETANSFLATQKNKYLFLQNTLKNGEAGRLSLIHAQLDLDRTMLSRIDAFIKVQQALGAVEDAAQYPLDPSQGLPVSLETNISRERKK